MPTLFEAIGEDGLIAARDAEVAYQNSVADLGPTASVLSSWGQGVFLYHCMPWLFAEPFPELRATDITTIAAAGLLYFRNVMILDNAVDNDSPLEPELFLAGSAAHERALTMLFRILPSDTEAFAQLRQYVRRYEAAVLTERSYFGRRIPWTDDELLSTMTDKAAILKASPMMVAFAAGEPGLVPVFDSIVGSYNTAYQVFDDLQDWRKDYSARRFGYVLSRGLTEGNLWDAAMSAEPPPPEMVGHHLFYSSTAEEALTLAVDQCRSSGWQARQVGAKRWATAISVLQNRLERVSSSFEHARTNGLAIAHRGESAADIELALDRYMAVMTEEHSRSLREARHMMRFNRSAGFTSAQEEHEGLVFQRAILGWVYGKMESIGVSPPDGLVDDNLDELLALQRNDDEGGWSYFPKLLELPPDSDDLAQVLLAFLVRPERMPTDAIARSVRLALDHHRHADGSVETWLIDPKLASRTKALYQAGIQQYWGRSVDPEVVANFFFALSQWDSETYSSEIAAGATYVASRQSESGLWSSTWYPGPYYGTYVCTRLLSTACVGEEQLARAQAQLLSQQRADGGWGTDERSISLYTALAVLALLACGARESAPDALMRALRYLLLSQRENGFWGRYSFIHMDVMRTKDQSKPQYLSYGSLSITGAFAAVALVELRKALFPNG